MDSKKKRVVSNYEKRFINIDGEMTEVEVEICPVSRRLAASRMKFSSSLGGKCELDWADLMRKGD